MSIEKLPDTYLVPATLPTTDEGQAFTVLEHTGNAVKKVNEAIDVINTAVNDIANYKTLNDTEVTTFKTDVQNTIQPALDIEDRLNNIITTPVSGVNAQEVIDAREGKLSLGDNLRDIRALNEAQLALKRDKASKLTQLDMSDEFIQQMAGVTPVNAIPADKSISPLKATNILTHGILYTGAGTFAFDFTDNTLTLTGVCYVVYNNQKCSIQPTVISTALPINNYYGFLYVEPNGSTSTIYVYGENQLSTVPTNFVLIGVYRPADKKVFGMDNVTINGVYAIPNDSVTKEMLKNDAVTTQKRTQLGEQGILINTKPLMINLALKTLTFTELSYIASRNSLYPVAKDTVIAINGTSRSYICYDITSSSVVSLSVVPSSEKQLYIGVIDVANKKVYDIYNCYIDGIYEALDLNVVESVDLIAKQELDNYSVKLANGFNDGFRFSFFTDCHLRNDNINFYKIRAYKHFLKYNLCDVNIIGGDIVTQNILASDTKILISQVTNELNTSKVPLLIAKGNHDTANANGYTEYVTNEQFSNLTMRVQNVKHYSQNKKSTYYYYDDNNYKIRVIVIDTFDLNLINNGIPVGNMQDWCGISQAQLDWLSNEALILNDSSWGVIIASHACIDDTIEYIIGGVALRTLLVAFKNGTNATYNYSYTFDVSSPLYPIQDRFTYTINKDFTSQGAREIICSVNGHAHYDFVKDSTIGKHIYVIGTDIYYPPTIPDGAIKPTRSEFTISAHGFDTFNIDRVNRKIYIYRFGAGSDRIIDY
jgi:hypothetical protein